MSRRLELRPFVPADILEAVAFLDRQSPDRGVRFAAAVGDTVDGLAANAEAGSPKLYADSRLIGFRSWPVAGFDRYLILYRVEPDRIEVFAIVYAGRDLPPLLRVRI